jgi:hypothetical protein
MVLVSSINTPSTWLQRIWRSAGQCEGLDPFEDRKHHSVAARGVKWKGSSAHDSGTLVQILAEQHAALCTGQRNAAKPGKSVSPAQPL